MTMAKATKATLFIAFIIPSLLSSANPCKTYKFSKTRHFHSCIHLPVLGSNLHWTYLPSTNTAQIAYRAPQTTKGWVAWGINLISTGMVRTQALIAFHDSHNGRITVYSSQINSYNPSMKPGVLSFHVSGLSAEYVRGEMIIFAGVGPVENATAVNIVWQEGDEVKNNVPLPHILIYQVGKILNPLKRWISGQVEYRAL